MYEYRREYEPPLTPSHLIRSVQVLGIVQVDGDCESWDGDWDEEEPRNLIDLKTGEQGEFHAVEDATDGIAIMGDFLAKDGDNK